MLGLDMTTVNLGEIMALITALVWAIAVILFKKSGESVHPAGLNLFKNTLAFLLFIPTIIISKEVIFYDAPAQHYLILIASGVLGIAIGDTLFLKSLNMLGAGLQAIVSCMYSPSIISLAFIFLDEKMSAMQIIGSTLIVSAVLTAISKKGTKHLQKKDLIIGIILGVLAQVVNGIGIVMVKPILDTSPLLWVTEMRLFGGVVSGFIILYFYPNPVKIIKSVFDSNWKYTVSGSFVGAYLAMMLWLAGMKFTEASIASALNQTSNIFIFGLSALILKEPINLMRIIGIILGVGGAIMVTFG